MGLHDRRRAGDLQVGRARPARPGVPHLRDTQAQVAGHQAQYMPNRSAAARRRARVDGARPHRHATGCSGFRRLVPRPRSAARVHHPAALLAQQHLAHVERVVRLTPSSLERQTSTSSARAAQPTPTPRSRRPPDRTSSVAVDFAHCGGRARRRECGAKPDPRRHACEHDVVSGRSRVCPSGPVELCTSLTSDLRSPRTPPSGGCKETDDVVGRDKQSGAPTRRRRPRESTGRPGSGVFGGERTHMQSS